MRALLWLLALAALAVGLAVAARYNEGYALIVLPPWRVELSLNLLVVLAILGFFLLYLLLRLVANTVRLPAQVQAFRSRRAAERSVRAFQHAVQLLFEGRYGHALKQAAAAHAGARAPGLSALIAARAARAMRDDEREAEWLARAQEHDADVRLARLMTELELHTEARRFEQAQEALDLLASSGQRHVAAQRLALRVYQATGRWDELLRVARQLEKHRVITPEHAASVKQRAHLAHLRSHAADAPALLGYWQSMSERERDSRLSVAVVDLLLEAGDCRSAQRLIEQRLDQAWEPALLPLYAECVGGDALARVTRAEKWLSEHPEDAELLLLLGRLCKRLELWGKAESYLEASLAVRPSSAAHVELARLLDGLQRAEDADRHYRAAATSAYEPQAAIAPTWAAASSRV